MEMSKAVTRLDLMDNNIGKLGCEFIGNMMHPKNLVPLIKLKLDHNKIGTEGLK